jgi:hypothetical protein
MKNGKTKRVNGVDCPRHAFAYAPDELDTSTWLLPVWVPGDAQKSLNAVKSSIARFDQAKNIPDSERAAVWFTLYGSLLAHGFNTDRRTFASKNEAAEKPPTPVPVKVKVVEQKPVKKDPKIEALIADADRRATAFLRSIGYE